MAAVLSPQHQFRSNASPGILINSLPPSPPLPSSPNKFIPNAPSNNSLSSSNSSSGHITDDNLSSNSHHSAGPDNHRPGVRSSSIPSSRRIRFAPLPDPRALESDALDDNGAPDSKLDSIPVPSASSSSSSPGTSFSALPNPCPISCSRKPTAIDTHPPPCGDAALNESTSTLPDPLDSQQATPKAGGSSPTTAKNTAWTSKPKSLLKPFLRRSSSPMAPASSGFNISTEDILTLGAINLFRTGSRDSRNGSGASVSSASGEEGSAGGGGGGLGLSLSRWTSARSYGAHGKEWFGSPLARTESTQSYKGDMRGRSTAKPKPATSSSKPKPTSAAAAPQAPLKSRRKGTRMLNGRVYGGRRIDGQNTNLFVTAKDEEPEFVEWGYGGMGSVKAGKQHGGTQWSRLQSDSGVGGGGVDDDDDGGGMGWVRKRKEARERERREREEKEARDRLEAETELVAPSAIDNQPSDPPPPPSSSVAEQQDQSSPTAPSSGIDEVLRSPPTTAAEAQPPDDNSPPADADEKQFVTCAVNVPAPHHHHHSHRTASYTGPNHSQGNSSANLSGLEADKEMVSSPLRMASFEGAIEMAMQGMDEKLEGDNTSESGGDDGDESEGGDDQDDDEPEDENEAERVTRTALGAGVEKISRHKDGG